MTFVVWFRFTARRDSQYIATYVKAVPGTLEVLKSAPAVIALGRQFQGETSPASDRRMQGIRRPWVLKSPAMSPEWPFRKDL